MTDAVSTAYLIYNSDDDKYIGRVQGTTGPETHRWVDGGILYLCENSLDILFNANTHIPRSRFTDDTVYKDTVKRIKLEIKQIRKFIKNGCGYDSVMVVPIIITGEGLDQDFDIDFVKAFKITP